MMEKMRGIRNDEYCKMLLKKFELDPNIGTKEMSLGVKRKLAVVTAFMHDPDILILDEPTSGLDPVMQQIFIDYIISEQKGDGFWRRTFCLVLIGLSAWNVWIIQYGRYWYGSRIFGHL